MTTKFTVGRIAIAMCDRCGFQFRLHELRTEIVKNKNVNTKVCQECWDPDQPQLSLGLYPVDDPQAVRNPRRDTTYLVAGNTGLQLLATNNSSVQGFGDPSGGSRIFQWGYAPVGGSRADDAGLTPNNLVLNVAIGTVTVVTT
jgi:hypothetical protein